MFSPSGNFFTTYPRHDKLISINKRHTGQTNKEFNFRHDWNSLISDDESLLFRHYTKDYFPHRETLVDYLADYARKLELRVRYNTTVQDVRQERKNPVNVRRGDGGGGGGGIVNVVTDAKGNEYRCK